MFILAMIVVPIAYMGACGAAVGVISQRVFHSICVCTGLQSSDCLHLYCSLLGHDTAALLDSGASHCFVDKEWLAAKGIKGLQPVRLREPTSFRQANGSQVECAYVYPCLKLKLGKKVVKVQMIPMDLGWSSGGHAIILGQTFLSRYNPRIDWMKRQVFVGSYEVPVVPQQVPDPEAPSSAGDKEPAHWEDKQCSRLQAKRLIRKGAKAFVISHRQLSGQVAQLQAQLDKRTIGIPEAISNLPDSVCHPSVKELLQKFSEVFEEPSGLPPDRPDCPVEHHIDLEPGAKVPARSPYKMSGPELAALRDILKDFSEKGFIQRSSSNFAAPVVLVMKPDGTYRFTCDFRGLNAISIKQAYPLPNCDTMFEQLAGSKFFSKLDMSHGFFQIRMRMGDRYKVAMTTRYGLWEWLVMPQGLQGSPSTFQRAMNTLFADMLDQGVMVYLDDILIHAGTEEEHDRLLTEVLTRLARNKFRAKLSKGVFKQGNIIFLGHKLSERGLEPMDDKLASVRDWPVPTTYKEVRSFLYLCSYYRKFVHRFAHIAGPIHEILKGTPKGTLPSGVWSPACQQSFEALKLALCSAPVLGFVRMGEPMHLGVDASDFAISGVLSQKGSDGEMHPVCYFSRKLNGPELHYPARERELLAIVSSLRHWQHLVEGVPVHIESDHQSLSSFMKPGTQLVNKQHKRWLDVLLGLDIRIAYIKGKDNVVPDALSRRPDFMVAAISQVESDLLGRIRTAGQKDSAYRELSKRKGYVCENGVMYEMGGKHKRVVVPRDTDLREALMLESHIASGHGGAAKTLARLTQNCYWRGIAADVRAFVKGCHVCQIAKRATTQPAGELRPLPVPQGKFEYISIDQVFGMPLSEGANGFITCTDLLSKYVTVIPCHETDDAPKCAQLLKQHVFDVFGLPKGIISDRDPKYTSGFWGSLFSSLGTKLHLTTAFMPSSDGQSERTNQTVEQVLRCMCMHKPESWVSHVSDVMRVVNGNKHASTGFSPAQLMFGYQPRSILDVALGPPQLQAVVPAAAEMLSAMKADVELARKHALKAQAWQKQAYDKRHKKLEFKKGDLVYLNAENINLAAAVCKKLKQRWLGPFMVRTVVSPLAYELELSRGLSRLHPVFHISKLKPAHKSSKLVSVAEEPEPILVDGEEEWEVEAIVKHRKCGRRPMEYLVTFVGFPLYEALWYREDELENAQELLAEYKAAKGITE
jgi:hypothetical protein